MACAELSELGHKTNSTFVVSFYSEQMFFFINKVSDIYS